MNRNQPTELYIAERERQVMRHSGHERIARECLLSGRRDIPSDTGQVLDVLKLPFSGLGWIDNHRPTYDIKLSLSKPDIVRPAVVQ